ncbi:MAG: tail fiber domain-containing protein [Flavobacteriales bacterium]|nr:tail fiber domain-containing protein [Flavobacteriales bacterium]
MGQKAEELDYTDMVLHWSDNPGKTLKDRLRFIFTSGFDSTATTGASSAEGLEGMRLFPLNNDEVNVGLGDFYAGNTAVPMPVVEPTERLDILNGRVRVRDLPTDPEANTLNKYLVVDDVDPSNPEYGVVKWRNLPTGTGSGSDCDWIMDSSQKLMRSGSAAVGMANPPSCPDRSWLYGVGTTNFNYKMQVYHDDLDRNVNGGIDVQYKADAGQYGIGIHSSITPSAGTTGPSDMVGVRGIVALAPVSGSALHGDLTANPSSFPTGDFHGVWGRMRAEEGSVSRGFGVRGDVTADVQGDLTQAFGVYGSANDGINRYGVYGMVPAAAVAPAFRAGVYGNSPVIYADTNTTGAVGSWAGYFQGMVRISSNAYVNGNVLVTSDASLKTNVEDITNARELIAALQPKSYEFIPQQHPHMQMPPGRQLGLMAPEVQEVLPELVERVPIPAEYDTTGTMVAEATSHLAINYNGFIPVLIAAVKEQQQTISEVTASVAQEASEMQDLRNLVEEQRTRLDQMEQLLAACCANPDGSRALPTQDTEEGPLNDTEGDRKLRIQPNPFSESTTVFYLLERSGRSQLMANSADGKQLRVLQEANLESGSYQYEWNTSDLAAGTYYVTLLLDGQPVVKKAVKVSR